MKILKKVAAITCISLLLFSPNVISGQEFIDFPVEITANATAQTHDISQGDVVINDSEEHIITGTTTDYKVVVEGGNPTITIENLDITSEEHDRCPFEIKGNCKLILSGDNRLVCTTTRSGLWLNNSCVTIEGNGSLYAEGSGEWAGICVWTYTGDSELIINSGNIIAKASGDYGAGIGGSHGDDGSITINGGTIEAYGGEYGAGIGGGGGGTNRKITINGGNITAKKGSSAHDDIGAGSNAGTGAVEIIGGTVNGVIYGSGYTVTIPQNVKLGESVQIDVSNISGSVEDLSKNIKISVSDNQGGTDENFCLTNGDETLNYNIKKDSETGANITNNSNIIESSNAISATLYFTEPTSPPKYSGEYTGTLTFTVSVE